MWTREQIAQQVLDHAKEKLEKGLLVRCQDIPDVEPFDYWETPHGDKDTIYTIAGMYAYSGIFPNESAKDLQDYIEEILIDNYPGYC